MPATGAAPVNPGRQESRGRWVAVPEMTAPRAEPEDGCDPNSRRLGALPALQNWPAEVSPRQGWQGSLAPPGLSRAAALPGGLLPAEGARALSPIRNVRRPASPPIVSA